MSDWPYWLVLLVGFAAFPIVAFVGVMVVGLYAELTGPFHGSGYIIQHKPPSNNKYFVHEHLTPKILGAWFSDAATPIIIGWCLRTKKYEDAEDWEEA